jgi:hypothetical protein
MGFSLSLSLSNFEVLFCDVVRDECTRVSAPAKVGKYLFWNKNSYHHVCFVHVGDPAILLTLLIYLPTIYYKTRIAIWIRIHASF